MGELAEKRATYEDLYTIPETAIGEIIDGELVVTPRPSPEPRSSRLWLERRNRAALSLRARGRARRMDHPLRARSHVRGRGEPLVPDLAGWKKERFSRSKEHNWIDVVPDWICEILSPSTAKKDRFTKMAIYGEHPR